MPALPSAARLTPASGPEIYQFPPGGVVTVRQVPPDRSGSGPLHHGPFGMIQSFAERAVVPAACRYQRPGAGPAGPDQSPRPVAASAPVAAA